jgi:hypothetical protein
MSAHPLRFKQPNRQAVARVLAQQAAGLDNHAEHLTQVHGRIETLAQLLATLKDVEDRTQARLERLEGPFWDIYTDQPLVLTLRMRLSSVERIVERSFWGRLCWLFTGK